MDVACAAGSGEQQATQQPGEQQLELQEPLLLMASLSQCALDSPAPHAANVTATATASHEAGFLNVEQSSRQTSGAGEFTAVSTDCIQQPAAAAATVADVSLPSKGLSEAGNREQTPSVDLQLPCGQLHKSLPRVVGASGMSSNGGRRPALWTTLDPGGAGSVAIFPGDNIKQGLAPLSAPALANITAASGQQQQQQQQQQQLLLHSQPAMHSHQVDSELQPPAAMHTGLDWKETEATESSTSQVTPVSLSVRAAGPNTHVGTGGVESQWPLASGGGSEWPITDASAPTVADSKLMLPLVADGLSSGDDKDSDMEEACRQQCVPAAFGSDEEAVTFYESHRRRMHSRTPSEREAVRVIVEDIRRALAKLPPADAAVAARHVIADASARAALPPSEDADDVWVIRDSYSEKLRRQDEQRRARIEMERRYEEEFRRKQAEEVFCLEHEDTQLMAHQEHHDTADSQRTAGIGSHASAKLPTTYAAGVLSDSESPPRPIPGTGSGADGSEYCEHDRDIAGNWFTKKGKYRPVVVGSSDSDSDSHEDASPRANLATAAATAFGSKGGYDVSALSSAHRPASAQTSYMGRAARLADYRGRAGILRGSRDGDHSICLTAASAHSAFVTKGSRTADTTNAPSSSASTAAPCQLQSKRELPQRPSGSVAIDSRRDGEESTSRGNVAASDGSGSSADDDLDDDDEGLDDYAAGGNEDDRSRSGSRHRKWHHRRPHGGSDGGYHRQHEDAVSDDRRSGSADYATDDETDRLVQNEYKSAHGGGVHIPEHEAEEMKQLAKRSKAKEVAVYDPDDPAVLIEGILFRASYLGSTQLVSEMQPSKAMRMMQAQEAVGRIKAPDGESQPSTEVDLFVSTEKVMVLNTNLKEIIMDHSLRSISYIADIENILVLMAKRSMVASPNDDARSNKKQQKLICHVFETEEAQLIAKSIGQAFQVAYMEFLKANGIDDPGLLKETTYEDILNQQEIAHDELDMFTRRDMQKEVVITKTRGEALGVVVVESGWGSMLPTIVLANMSATGPATRCGQLNIGDQIMAINGTSLVGLPLSTCQEHIKGLKGLTLVKLTIVSRPPVIDVLIKRPDVKYQLGFSVQNGIICSLLRGGIAERGGVRVGHRIIEINGQSVVATSHEKIVYTLSTSVGEIRMKTMPMSIFRLLTGQEVPHYI